MEGVVRGGSRVGSGGRVIDTYCPFGIYHFVTF